MKKTVIELVEELEDKKKSMEFEIEKISEMIDVLKDTKEYNVRIKTPNITKEYTDIMSRMLERNTNRYSGKNVIL